MRCGFEGSLIHHGLFVYLDIYYSPCLLHDDVFPLILCHILNLEVYILFQYCSISIEDKSQ